MHHDGRKPIASDTMVANSPQPMQTHRNPRSGQAAPRERPQPLGYPHGPSQEHRPDVGQHGGPRGSSKGKAAFPISPCPGRSFDKGEERRKKNFFGEKKPPSTQTEHLPGAKLLQETFWGALLWLRGGDAGMGLSIGGAESRDAEG